MRKKENKMYINKQITNYKYNHKYIHKYISANNLVHKIT